MFFEEADDDNMVEFPHAGKDIDIFLMEYKTSRSVTFASLFFTGISLRLLFAGHSVFPKTACHLCMYACAYLLEIT